MGSDETEAQGIRVAAWLGSDHYRPLQVQRLQVAVDIPKERLFVHEGLLDLVLPFVIRRRRRRRRHGTRGALPACSHSVCHSATTLVLRLPLELVREHV